MPKDIVLARDMIPKRGCTAARNSGIVEFLLRDGPTLSTSARTASALFSNRIFRVHLFSGNLPAQQEHFIAVVHSQHRDRCAFRKARDLFGNDLRHRKSPSAPSQ